MHTQKQSIGIGLGCTQWTMFARRDIGNIAYHSIVEMHEHQKDETTVTMYN